MEVKKINKFEGEIAFLSFFWSGFFPYAPGTFASALTIPLLYFFGVFKAPFFFYIPILVIGTVLSCFITDYVQKKHELHDPSWIVIDEVLGMFTCWLFYLGNDPLWLFILFALFRFFDIVKIWPASYFDKKVTHGSGTILDDIVSGIFAGLVFLLIKNFF